MSLLGKVAAVERLVVHAFDPATSRRPATTHAADRMEAPKKRRAPTTWWAGRPLSEGKNAHKTNTREQFSAAMKDGSNWFEGDIRKELHGDRVEMRHDKGPETGDNLTLKEWLAMGKASGRGLKLDVKDSDQLPEIIKETKAAGIPSGRLMFNLGDGELDTYGKQIRKEFPHAVMAINTREDGDKMDGAEVKRMIAHAKQLGQPATFVVRYDRLTDDAIKKLHGHGTISVWNDTGRGGVSKGDIERVTRSLRRRGVDGMIDIRPSESTLDKIKGGIDHAKNAAGEWIHGAADTITSIL